MITKTSYTKFFIHPTLQAFRGIAVILVVLFHATQFFTAYYQIAPFGGFFMFGFSGVHIFFVLSGFIIFKAHFADIGKPQRYVTYIKKRFIRIYPTYWVVLAILSSLFLFRGTATMQDVYQNIGLLYRPRNFFNPVCWTLLFEILFYVIFSFLILNRIIGSLLMLCWVLGVATIYLLDMQLPFQPYYIFHNYVGLFMVGLAASYAVIHLKHLPPEGKNRIAYASCLGGVLVFSATALYCLRYKIINWDQWLITLGFGLAGGMFMVCSLSEILEGFFQRQKILIVVGNASYSIYLLHYPFVRWVVPYLKDHFSTDSSVSVTLAFVAVSAMSLMVGWLFYCNVERPLLKFMRRRLL